MWLRQLFDTIAASGGISGKQTVPQKRFNKNHRKTKQKKNGHPHTAGISVYGNAGFQKKSRSTPAQNGKFLIAYHGTNSPANAASVFSHGWLVGSGNAYGDGIYFTQNLSEAKTYAGSGGVYLKCSIRMGKTCHWNSTIEKQFSQWCTSGSVQPDNSAKTSFLLYRGFDTLLAGDIILVLEPRYANPTAWKRRNRHIRILSVHRADNDQKIRV